MGFKLYLKDQLVSFSALTLLVWSYDLENRPEMTYNVSSGTLSLYTTYLWCGSLDHAIANVSSVCLFVHPSSHTCEPHVNSSKILKYFSYPTVFLIHLC